MRKKMAILAFGVALVASGLCSQRAVACGNPETIQHNTSFRHLAFDSFNATGNTLTVTYPSNLTISCTSLMAGMNEVAAVTPGSGFSFSPSSGIRYDITGVADDGNGEFNFITPIKHPLCSGTFPAPWDSPLGTCSMTGGGCALMVRAGCGGMTYVTASCSGLGNGCFDQSTTGVAQCAALTTSKSGGLATTVYAVSTQACP